MCVQAHACMCVRAHMHVHARALGQLHCLKLLLPFSNLDNNELYLEMRATPMVTLLMGVF